MAESFPADDPASSLKTARDLAGQRVRRRNRMITSCLECRRRKLKCDKTSPCTNCNKFSRECLFLAPALDSVSQKRLNEIKEKMGSLERTLEEDVMRRKAEKDQNYRDRKPSESLPGEESESEDDGPVPEDEHGLEVTPLATLDAAYEEDTNEDVLDLGFKIGKFRMSERLGGLFRPKIAEEMSFTLAEGGLNGDSREAPLKDSQSNFLEPGPSFIPPGSGFIFGDIGSRRNLVDYLPTKGAADILVQQYHQRVHFLARVVHWPSFQLQYDNFWRSVLSGMEPPYSLQALFFAVMMNAVASMEADAVEAIFQASHRAILVNFQTGVEISLGKAQFLRTTKIETLQALVLYLIPMCRDETSRAHSVLVGTAIRLAESLGLHRDPTDVFGMSPIESHIRRTLWFQLCFLDYRSSEAQGPRPSIKREDYDVRLPLNVNDTDLMTSRTLKDKENEWTDMTLSRLRFECTEMHRVVWHDRNRLEKKKVSITYCLGKIESFRKAMETKYKFLDLSIPIQEYARVVLDILLLRMHIMILHKYHNSHQTRIPDRLRQIMITSGTQLTEAAVKLSTMPQFRAWRWYNGTYSQWHVAFLLLFEVYAYPNRREADRIWAFLDYVFEPDQSLDRHQKARSIIASARDRAKVYRDLRRMKEPLSMKGLDLPVRAVENLHISNPANVGNIDVDQRLAVSNAAVADPGRSSSFQDSVAVSDAANTSWSFDSPSSFFVVGKPTRSQVENNANNTTMQLLPSVEVSTYSQQQQLNPNEPWSGSDVKSSPGASSGVTDAWPPYISATQQGWRMAPEQPPPGQYQASESPIPSPPAAAYGNTAMGLLSGQYIPPVMSPTSTYSPPALHRNSTDGTSDGIPGGPQNNNASSQSPQANQGDPMVLDIDWTEWDKLFPPDVNTGKLDMPS